MRKCICAKGSLFVISILMLIFMQGMTIFATEKENYEDENGNGYYKPWGYYILEDGTVEITSCDAEISEEEKVEFPNEINGRTVSDISSSILGRSNEAVKEIVLPKGLTSISDKEFYNCVSLEKINIPSGITEIGENAFYGCRSLKEVNIEEGMAGSIGKWAFKGCYSLQSIIIPDGVTKIDDSFNNDIFIFGKQGSVAEEYTKQNEYATFVPMNVENMPVETITVSTSEELRNAIGSYRHIILKDGQYRLPSISQKVSLTIEAENVGGVEFVERSSDLPVANISNSYNINFKGCIFGHYLPEEGCTRGANVIDCRNSIYVNISDCDLFGCGFIGVYAVGAENLVVQNCIIRDCSDSIVYNSNSVYYGAAKKGNAVTIRDCIISGNAYIEKYASSVPAVGGDGAVIFENCKFLNNYSKTFCSSDIATVKNCIFSNNAWDGQTPQAYGVCLNGVTWQVEGQDLKIGYPITLEDGTVIESTTEKVLKYGQYSLPWRDYENLNMVTKDNGSANWNGWISEGGKQYWYENGVRQGYDPNNESYRGKEIYDPASNAWYWLDNVQQGAKAVSKDVYQESYSAYADREDGTGKWVRYDENGHMVKGWQTTEAGTYYFETITGAMAKGNVTIDGVNYYFDEVTGVLQQGAYDEGYGDGWNTIDGVDYWYENGVRQGYDPNNESYRGKEIYDPASNAWYWLDNVQQGAKAVSKDVYQESYSAYADREDGTGKWVRYDENGHMVKGWQTTEAGTYYFETVTGAMAKGTVEIDGISYTFDWNTGVLQQ